MKDYADRVKSISVAVSLMDSYLASALEKADRDDVIELLGLMSAQLDAVKSLCVGE